MSTASTSHERSGENASTPEVADVAGRSVDNRGPIVLPGDRVTITRTNSAPGILESYTPLTPLRTNQSEEDVFYTPVTSFSAEALDVASRVVRDAHQQLQQQQQQQQQPRVQANELVISVRALGSNLTRAIRQTRNNLGYAGRPLDTIVSASPENSPGLERLNYTGLRRIPIDFRVTLSNFADIVSAMAYVDTLQRAWTADTVDESIDPEKESGVDTSGNKLPQPLPISRRWSTGETRSTKPVESSCKSKRNSLVDFRYFREQHQRVAQYNGASDPEVILRILEIYPEIHHIIMSPSLDPAHKAYCPHMMEMVSPECADINNYCVIGRTSVTRYIKGKHPKQMTSKRWAFEQSTLIKLRQIPFFKNFRLLKTFNALGQHVDMSAFGRSKRRIRGHLLTCDPVLADMLLLVRTMCLDMAQLSLIQVDAELTYTVSEFMEDQEHNTRDVISRMERCIRLLVHLTSWTCWDHAIGAGLAVEREGRRMTAPKRISEMRKLQRLRQSAGPLVSRARIQDDVSMGVWLNDNEAGSSLEFITLKKQYCEKLSRFIFLIDMVLRETIRQIYCKSLERIREYLQLQLSTFPSEEKIVKIVKDYLGDIQIPNPRIVTGEDEDDQPGPGPGGGARGGGGSGGTRGSGAGSESGGGGSGGSGSGGGGNGGRRSGGGGSGGRGSGGPGGTGRDSGQSDRDSYQEPNPWTVAQPGDYAYVTNLDNDQGIDVFDLIQPRQQVAGASRNIQQHQHRHNPTLHQTTIATLPPATNRIPYIVPVTPLTVRTFIPPENEAIGTQQPATPATGSLNPDMVPATQTSSLSTYTLDGSAAPQSRPGETTSSPNDLSTDTLGTSTSESEETSYGDDDEENWMGSYHTVLAYFDQAIHDLFLPEGNDGVHEDAAEVATLVGDDYRQVPAAMMPQGALEEAGDLGADDRIVVSMAEDEMEEATIVGEGEWASHSFSMGSPPETPAMPVSSTNQSLAPEGVVYVPPQDDTSEPLTITSDETDASEASHDSHRDNQNNKLSKNDQRMVQKPGKTHDRKKPFPSHSTKTKAETETTTRLPLKGSNVDASVSKPSGLLGLQSTRFNADTESRGRLEKAIATRKERAPNWQGSHPRTEVNEVETGHDVCENATIAPICPFRGEDLFSDLRLHSIFFSLHDSVKESPVDDRRQTPTDELDDSDSVIDFPILDGNSWDCGSAERYMNVRGAPGIPGSSVDAGRRKCPRRTPSGLSVDLNQNEKCISHESLNQATNVNKLCDCHIAKVKHSQEENFGPSFVLGELREYNGWQNLCQREGYLISPVSMMDQMRDVKYISNQGCNDGMSPCFDAHDCLTTSEESLDPGLSQDINESNDLSSLPVFPASNKQDSPNAIEILISSTDDDGDYDYDEAFNQNNEEIQDSNITLDNLNSRDRYGEDALDQWTNDSFPKIDQLIQSNEENQVYLNKNLQIPDVNYGINTFTQPHNMGRENRRGKQTFSKDIVERANREQAFQAAIHNERGRHRLSGRFPKLDGLSESDSEEAEQDSWATASEAFVGNLSAVRKNGGRGKKSGRSNRTIVPENDNPFRSASGVNSPNGIYLPRDQPSTSGRWIISPTTSSDSQDSSPLPSYFVNSACLIHHAVSQCRLQQHPTPSKTPHFRAFSVTTKAEVARGAATSPVLQNNSIDTSLLDALTRLSEGQQTVDVSVDVDPHSDSRQTDPSNTTTMNNNIHIDTDSAISSQHSDSPSSSGSSQAENKLGTTTHQFNNNFSKIESGEKSINHRRLPFEACKHLHDDLPNLDMNSCHNCHKDRVEILNVSSSQGGSGVGSIGSSQGNEDNQSSAPCSGTTASSSGGNDGNTAGGNDFTGGGWSWQPSDWWLANKKRKSELKPMFHAVLMLKNSKVTLSPDVYDITVTAFNMIHDMEEQVLGLPNLSSNPVFFDFTRPTVAGQTEISNVPRGPTLEPVLRRDMRVTELKNGIYQSVDDMFDYTNVFVREMQLLYDRVFHDFEQLPKQVGDVVFYCRQLAWHDAQMKLCERLPDSQKLGMFLIDLSPYKDSVNICHQRSMKRTHYIMNGDIIQKVNQYLEKLDDLLSVLESRPTTTDLLFKRLTVMDSIEEHLEKILNTDGNQIASLYELVDKFGVPHAPAERHSFESSHSLVSSVRASWAESVKDHEEVVAEIQRLLERDVLWLQQQVKKELKPTVEQSFLLDGSSDPKEVMEALTAAEEIVRGHVNKANFVREVQKYLELPECQFKELFQLASRHVNTRNLWLLMADWDAKLHSWKHQSFASLNIQKINNYTFKYMEACDKLEKVLPKNSVVTVFGEKVDVMLRWLNFIIEFRGHVIKPRHWRQLEEALGIQFGEDLPPTLASLMSVNAVEQQKTLHAILNKARAESNIQAEFDEVNRQCQELSVPTQHRPKVIIDGEEPIMVYLMSDTFEIEESFNYCLMELERIAQSPHAGFLQSALDDFVHKILVALENLVQWAEMQMKLSRLRRLIMRHPDVSEHSSTEVTKYRNTYMAYSAFIQQVSANPCVLTWCSSADLRNLIQEHNDEIVGVYHRLKRSIDTRQGQNPPARDFGAWVVM